MENETLNEPRETQFPKFDTSRDLTPAEVNLLNQLTRRAAAEAEYAESVAKVNAMVLEREVLKHQRERYADAYDDHVYHFSSAVDDTSVQKCIKQLNAWHREDAECKMTILFDSPGGGVIEGFHLFDHILDLRQTHHIVTSTRGYAASMGGILLQAGDERVMGPNASLMIHEVAFGARGKIGDVEDAVEFAKALWKRAVDIFTTRAEGADNKTATKRITRRKLEEGAKRKDWWISAQDALAFGLVDAIR